MLMEVAEGSDQKSGSMGHCGEHNVACKITGACV